MAINPKTVLSSKKVLSPEIEKTFEDIKTGVGDILSRAEKEGITKDGKQILAPGAFQAPVKPGIVSPGDQPLEPIIQPPEPILPITEESNGVVTTDAPRAIDAQAEIDAEEATIKEGESTQQELDTLTRQQKLQNLREEMGLDPDTGEKLDKPALPTFESSFEALRSEHGIAAIESRLNTLNEQIRDLDAATRLGTQKAEGRLAPVQVIGQEQLSIRRQAQESLDALNREKATLIEELNTKNTLISNLMSFKQLDYNTASDEYNKKFTQSLQMMNFLAGEEAQEEKEANQQRDDARANLNVITGILQDSGKTFSELDLTMQSSIRNLEVKAGIPQGSFETLMTSKPNVEVMATINGVNEAGEDIISFIYRDPKTGKAGVAETMTTGGISELPSEEDFTKTQKQKLEQAGLLGADRQDQLDFLHGEETFSVETFKKELTTAAKANQDLGLSREDAIKSMTNEGLSQLGGDELPDAIKNHIEEAVNSVYGEKPKSWWSRLWETIKRGGGSIADVLTLDEASAYIAGDEGARKLINELYGGESALGRRSVPDIVKSLSNKGEDGELLIRKTLFDIMTDIINRGKSLSKENFNLYGKLIQEFGFPEKGKNRSFISHLPGAIIDTLKEIGGKVIGQKRSIKKTLQDIPKVINDTLEDIGNQTFKFIQEAQAFSRELSVPWLGSDGIVGSEKDNQLEEAINNFMSFNLSGSPTSQRIKNLQFTGQLSVPWLGEEKNAQLGEGIRNMFVKFERPIRPELGGGVSVFWFPTDLKVPWLGEQKRREIEAAIFRSLGIYLF